jgi:hypothetical protein
LDRKYLQAHPNTRPARFGSVEVTDALQREKPYGVWLPYNIDLRNIESNNIADLLHPAFDENDPDSLEKKVR